mgnify:CR=1 FL=1
MGRYFVDLSYGMEKLTGTTQKHVLGTRGVLPDGRVFRYAFLSSAAAVLAGKLIQSRVIVTGHGKDLAVKTAAAVGAESVTITMATTATLVDEYAGGYIQGNDQTGAIGNLYRIKEVGPVAGNAHLAGGATADIVYNLAEPLVKALTTTSQVGLVHNLYKDVIVQPTSVTGITLGVTPADIALSAYFLMQTWGPASVLLNGTPTIQKQVIWGATTAGSLDIKVETDIAPQVGIVMGGSTLVSTEYGLVFLTIAP